MPVSLRRRDENETETIRRVAVRHEVTESCMRATDVLTGDPISKDPEEVARGSVRPDAESVAIASGSVLTARSFQTSRFALRLGAALSEHSAGPDRWSADCRIGPICPQFAHA